MCKESQLEFSNLDSEFHIRSNLYLRKISFYAEYTSDSNLNDLKLGSTESCTGREFPGLLFDNKPKT